MTPSGWSSGGLAAIAALLRERTGLTFSDARKPAAEAAIDAAMRRSGTVSQSDYLAGLRTDAALLDALIGDVTVGETFFFREPAQFARLAGTILPELRAARPPAQALRLWSAGCASGEEAYSLAFLCDELGIGEGARVLGTDIARRALAAARRGRYAKWSLRIARQRHLARWFAHRDGRYVVAERIRRRVRFGYLNLADDAYALPCWNAADIVLCRNVLIYFDARTAQRIGRQLLDCLSVGGWLLTGPSDPAIAADARFRAQATDSGMLYRREAEDAVRGIRAASAVATQAAAKAVAADPATVLAAPRDGERAPVAVPSPDTRALPALEARLFALLGAGANDEAAAFAADAVRAAPTSATLRFLHALALIETGSPDHAVNALRCALYLEPCFAMAHLALAVLHGRHGDRRRSQAAYRAAHNLFGSLPRDRAVPLGGGLSVGDIAAAARAQLGQFAITAGD